MNQFAEAFSKSGIKTKTKDKKQPKKNLKNKPKQNTNPNLGWLFYKDYFIDLNYENFENNEDKIKNKIDNILKQSLDKTDKKVSLGNTKFELTTTYPGLLLGSGYLHELPSVKSQAILGFDFDYTSGLPIIRGSSIKGTLRSAFSHKEYLKSLLKKNVDIKKLEEEIFEGDDIFFDSYIVKSNGKILSDDYITPHKDLLKDPIPLRFIKISPEVTFRFEFELYDSSDLSKEKKCELFKDIILDLGLGAKTNVGYGKFKM